MSEIGLHPPLPRRFRRIRRLGRGLRIEHLTPMAATVIVAFSSVGFALVAYFARALNGAGMASPAITLFRFLTTAVVLSPFLQLGREKRSATLWALGSGLGVGLGWIAYVEALTVVPVSTAGVVYMTYPLFAMLAAWALFGLRPGARSVAGGLLVACAALLALSPAGTGPGHVGTLLIAFAAPFSFGVAITILTERLNLLDPLERIAGVALGAVVGVSPTALSLSGSQMFPQDSSSWWLVAGMGLATSLLPKVGYAMAAPFIGSARTAMAGAVELPTMFVLGWLMFRETIGPLELMSGLVVLTAVLLTPSRPPTSDLESRWARGERRRRMGG